MGRQVLPRGFRPGFDDDDGFYVVGAKSTILARHPAIDDAGDEAGVAQGGQRSVSFVSRRGLWTQGTEWTEWTQSARTADCVRCVLSVGVFTRRRHPGSRGSPAIGLGRAASAVEITFNGRDVVVTFKNT